MTQALTTVSPIYGMNDVERMARALASSKLFGVQNPEQALALCLVAQAEGRHPASAAADYHIIQGRPSKKADAMLRDFLLNGGKVEWHKLDDTVADATFSHPAGGSLRISWDQDRVKKAAIKNDMHGKYPRQMLRSRVVSEGVRSVFPAATSGMYVPEEVESFEQCNVTPAPSQPAISAPKEKALPPKASRVRAAMQRDPEADDVQASDGPDYSEAERDAMGQENRPEDVAFIQDAEVWFAETTDRLAIEDAKQSNAARLSALPKNLVERFDTAADTALKRCS